MHNIINADIVPVPKFYSDNLKFLSKLLLNKNPDSRLSISDILSLPYVKDKLLLLKIKIQVIPNSVSASSSQSTRPLVYYYLEDKCDMQLYHIQSKTKDDNLKNPNRNDRANWSKGPKDKGKRNKLTVNVSDFALNGFNNISPSPNSNKHPSSTYRRKSADVEHLNDMLSIQTSADSKTMPQTPNVSSYSIEKRRINKIRNKSITTLNKYNHNFKPSFDFNNKNIINNNNSNFFPYKANSINESLNNINESSALTNFKKIMKATPRQIVITMEGNSPELITNCKQLK